jgi:haloacetate dehalogenase
MAADVVALMRALGHERFAVVGHDRGALVAFRTAMDHPGAVERLVEMDGLPVIEHVERCDARFARAWWHWFFFAQTEKPAERIISADPEAWYRPNRERMGAENLADYLRAIHDPATVHAMLEDYRAGLGIDVEHDAADRAARRRIACPTLVLWSEQDDMEELYGDPIAIWSAWCDDVRAETIDAGHHVAEEAPEALAATLLRFLGAR